MNNTGLRGKVRALKAFHGISYKQLAEMLEIRQDSIYNWLGGKYEFSEEKEMKLRKIIDTMEK